MSGPLELDDILSEFKEEDEAWVLQDKSMGLYVTTPDSRYPDRIIIRFFLSREDADRILKATLDVCEGLQGKDIQPVSVRLKEAMRRIASSKDPNMADAFVVHSPNEVFEFLWDRE
ncbi:MAG TPA: hypothetical protein VG406_03790 [Isosphaeraceae bacterium]|nr:hypothetical protein [Isosphaeraceae bacterium]